jgi:hypothetical protein
MPLPSIHTIRISLAEIDGALVDDPSTSPVDTGKIPCVQIHDPEGSVQPTEDLLGRAPSDEENDETDNDEASIIFEIPPELDDRQVREALSQHPGRDFERLVQQNGVDALGWYLPFHQRIAQHGIYISSAGASATAGAFVAPAISRASNPLARQSGMGRIPRLARSCVPRAPARMAETCTRSATRHRNDLRTRC